MKAKARAILADHWIPDYAHGTQELWTPKLVREALVDAFRMLRRSGPIGPSRLKAFWPEYRVDQADFVQQVINKTLKPKRSPTYHTRMNVTRMEEVVLGWKDKDGHQHPAWLNDPLLMVAEDLRIVLLAWINAELRGEAFKELCLRKGWTYNTYRGHRDRAAGIIAQTLNRARVEVWL
jgi:hypothetical protein